MKFKEIIIKGLEYIHCDTNESMLCYMCILYFMGELQTDNSMTRYPTNTNVCRVVHSESIVPVPCLQRPKLMFHLHVND